MIFTIIVGLVKLGELCSLQRRIDAEIDEYNSRCNEK